MLYAVIESQQQENEKLRQEIETKDHALRMALTVIDEPYELCACHVCNTTRDILATIRKALGGNSNG